MTPVLIAIGAQIVLSILLTVWTRTRVRRFLGSSDEIDRIRREIGSLIVELDSSADRNVTVIEDRLSALKDALAEADKRIALLGQDRSRRQAEDTVYDRLGRGPEPRQPRQPRPAEAPPAPRPAQAQELPSQAEPPPADVPFIRFSDKPLSIEEPFADKVIALSRRGFSSDIIAARLGATMAEVDLVLSLEREREGLTKEP